MDAPYFLNDFIFYDHNNLDCVEKLEQVRRKGLNDVFIDDSYERIIEMMSIIDLICNMIRTDYISQTLEKLHLLRGKIISSLSFTKTVKGNEGEDEEN